MSGEVLSQTHLIREFRQREKIQQIFQEEREALKRLKEIERVERMWEKRERVTK